MQGIERNSKLGYYKVGDQVFYSKPQAYIYATQTGIEPSWYFNNVEFAKFDWLHEPEVGIRELYRLRAQQLRDKYDWIRLESSGGGDSTTAIFSFLLNDIHLDEVVFRYPEQVDKNVTNDPFNTKPENTLSERQFAAEPLLKWITTHYPNVRVTIQDYSENLLNDNYMQDESWVFTTRDWFQPGHGIKHNNFGTNEHRATADSGKSICVIYGIDKPKVALINNQWYAYFLDVHANHPNPVVNEYTNITSELFYWTPDIPELVSKQSHMVKNWFDMPQNKHLRHLVKFPNSSVNQRTTYESIVKSIIYPDYDLSTWQTAKPSNSFYNEMDHWFHTNLQGTKLFLAWQGGLQMLVDKIDPKYFEFELSRPVGLQRNFSLFYHLGPSSSTDVEPVLDNNDYKTISKQPITMVQNRKIKKIVV